MKNVLVTGALGHIGSYLIRKIPYRIVAVDNMLTQRYCSLFNLPLNVAFWERDFTTLTVEELKEFDVVLHLAAITDAAGSFNNKELVKKVNVDDTIEFIKKVKEAKVGQFIFPSSTSVYGRGYNDEFVVEDKEECLFPQSPYAESKLEVEKAIKDLLGNSKTEYIVFRCGTIFGMSPGARFHTAINKFCYQAAFNQKLTVWRENYNQVRPYLGLSDLYTAIMLAIDDEIPGYQIYNVLTGNYKLKQIIDIIKFFVPYVQVEFIDTPLLNQFSYNVSISKIVERGGYQSKDDVGKAIRKTLEHLGKINYV
jgi:UDP-glucose 4-epimerase